MLYYLAQALRDNIGLFNAFTYNTVRSGAAAFTAFVICLLWGPRLIEWLRAVKLGQHIRKDHVADLHELHKGKAGTPTMGGVLIVVPAVVALLLWSDLTNPLLRIAVIVLVLLSAVGFIDDFISIRRKQNLGLTAKAKFSAQIIIGLVLGVYLVNNPITVSATRLSAKEVSDWPKLIDALQETDKKGDEALGYPFWQGLPGAIRERVLDVSSEADPDRDLKSDLVRALNDLLPGRGIYDEEVWRGVNINGEGGPLFDKGVANLSNRELLRFNRLLLETAFPDAISISTRNLHTRVEIPGLKDVLIPLGFFYIFFVVLIIVGSSNAVNLTDGLDGLAIGASTVSLLAYTGIAYIVSRADWSSYLYLIHVPEASELTVFGAALLGAGLGFMWYNCHPAEVFMGDTGSLALGGAIGTMAILTKQELLLIVVGGLFVIEAGSVVLQVASYKLRGKRVFKMAPLHHHFELLGWSETKVTIRFWIIALIFALMSLATLKLR